MNYLKAQLAQIPPNVKTFLIRAFFVFIIWKLLYIFILYPAGIPNHFLTNSTAWGTAKFVEITTGVKTMPWYAPNAAYVYNVNKQSLLIGNSCNALEVMVLHIGFILCLPGFKWRRMITYITLGVLSIYLLNVLRCAGLFVLYMHGSSLFGFMHKYIFKFILYAFVFMIWWRYTTNKNNTASA